jgi:hypothetical protein
VLFPPEDPMPNTAIILPWVDLSEPMNIGPVTILPKSEALAAVDNDQRSTLRDLLDSYVHSPPSRLPKGASAEPPDSTACAVLVDYYGDDEDTREIDEALAAIHALMFATIVENRYGASANGAVFEYEVHSKLELGFAVHIRHHMEGWSFNGFVPGRDYRVKPWYVGKFHHGGRQKGKPFVDALFRWWQAEPAHVHALFRVLRAATSESPDLEPGVVFALYAKAMVIAASAPGDKDRKEDLASRVHVLVAPHLGAPRVSGEFPYRLEQAWDATRQARNSGVHLNKSRHTLYDFEVGGALEHIAFRTVYALVVARLGRDGHLNASDRSSDPLVADVAATESWLEMLAGAPDDQRPGHKWTKARQGARSAYLKAQFLTSGFNPSAPLA